MKTNPGVTHSRRTTSDERNKAHSRSQTAAMDNSSLPNHTVYDTPTVNPQGGTF